MDPTNDDSTRAGSSASDTPGRQESAELRSLLAAIVSTSDDAIVSKGLDGVIRSWNHGAERLFGYSAAEAVGRPIDLLIPAELRHEERSILERIGRGELIEHFETVRVAKDGRRLDISLAISPIRDAAGRVVGASKVARDVTERKRAEQALRASEERLRAIVESQSEMLCRFRSDGTILFVNRAYAQALGTTPEALMQRNFWDFVPLEDRAGVRAMLGGLTPDAPEVRIENRFETAAGLRWTLWTNRALSFDEHGRVCEAQSAGIDITDRKRAEQALLEADRRKNEFLATLGHELRNPLAPMRSMLDILRHGNLDPESTRDAHEMMARQLDVLVRLVDDLLDVSRITQGKLQLRKERVDMAALVASAVRDIGESVAAAGQELVVVQPDEPVMVVADPVRIGQVLTNLLSNATKFSPEGGRIELVIEPGADEVRISVRDDGLGIPSDKLDSVFEMFSQIDGSFANGRRGLGIGLSLVRWLVDLHDGRVEAASAGLGRGSEFSVWLPRGPLDETTLETPREDTGPIVSDGPCRRVLVVDDNLDAASSLAMLVEILGHEVRLAADGFEAVEIASAFRPELVLLDIGLPGLSGYDVARRIRDQAWGRGVVLAAVTGWGQEADRQLALEAGCDLHATKPLTLKTLRAVFETVAQRAPAERGAR